MSYWCKACGALSATAECDACGHHGGVRAELARFMGYGRRGKFDPKPRRQRWWHLPKWKG